LHNHLKFRILPQRLLVCRFSPDAPIPGWALQGNLFSITRTPDELSIVCIEDHAMEASTSEGGWVALKLEGPFPFSMTGVLTSFLQPLAEARIPIFAISTFDTDYVLIKHKDLDAATAALAAAGHEMVGKAAC
jgi:hypothetical protein